MSHRILVVEDHEETRGMLRTLLKHYNHEVLEADSGEELLEQIDTLTPDLIILDIRLPGLNGCETVAQLREAGHTTPVFLFSENYDLFRDTVQSCGADGFFPKSKGPMELITAIADKLASAQSTV
ncbi:MAG: response regulator transcription factor [Gemmatimonadota bacterium]